ncbi:MAG: PD-(D/E)XK nuclease family protein [Acidimicrobiia bacterium]|nr:PD-(D/E)XK nuclease family protein [Acidimicrobiia bacterium]
MADMPPYLSPSSASVFTGCPRRWRFKYIDRLSDPSGRAALVGTFAHRVLELLCQGSPEERTLDQAKELARNAWDEFAATDDYVNLELDQDEARAFRWQAWLAIAGLWDIEDPAGVDVVSTEQKIQVELGSVPFVGIIDRVDRIGGELVVSDYKSGTLPGHRWRQEKIQQVMLYAAALAGHTGQRPSRARLLYLGQRVLDVRVTQSRIDDALAKLSEAWTEIDKACGRDEFEPRPSVLCGWCPFVAECPEGRAELLSRADAGRLPAHAPSAALVA